MTYTVAYTNTGYGAAQDVTITTTLPTGTAYVGYGWQDSGGGTYTYAHDGTLPPQSPGHTITFKVRHADTPQVSAPEFNTPFTIAGRGGIAEDENPADNTTSVPIGVPDLVVDGLTVEPDPTGVQPGVPVTFTLTITVMNRGSGMAWDPDDGGGFFVDVFTAPVASSPFVRDGELRVPVDVITPGFKSAPLVVATSPITPVDHDLVFFVKVDNHGRYGYGLVPEFDEANNLAVRPPRVYLPSVLRTKAYYEDHDDWRYAYGPLTSGVTYLAYPEDVNDWYYFTLPAEAEVTVSVTDYAPTSDTPNTVVLYPDVGDGPGDYIEYYIPEDSTEMFLGPHRLGPGKYYVRVYTVKRQSTIQLYRLKVTY
jgi:hypothetical protein